MRLQARKTIQLGELTILAYSANETLSGRNPPIHSAYAGLLKKGKRSRPQHPFDHRYGTIVQHWKEEGTLLQKDASTVGKIQPQDARGHQAPEEA